MGYDKSLNAQGAYWNAPKGVMKEKHSSWYLGQINIADREAFCKWLMQQPTTVQGGVPIQVTTGTISNGDRVGQTFHALALDTRAIEYSQKKAEEEGANAQASNSASQDDDLPF